MDCTAYRNATDLHPAARVASRTTGRLALVADIALPLLGYYAAHAVGASDMLALLVATAASGLRLVWSAVAARRVSWFAAVMLGIFGVGLGLAFVGGSPRFLLLKDSITTGVIGLVFLLSLLAGRPLTLSAAQASRPGRADELGRLYDRPAGRRVFRTSALGWGIGMLGESALRVPLIYLLPIDVLVGLSTVLMIGAMVATGIWNVAYVTAAARRHPELSVLLPGPPRR